MLFATIEIFIVAREKDTHTHLYAPIRSRAKSAHTNEYVCVYECLNGRANDNQKFHMYPIIYVYTSLYTSAALHICTKAKLNIRKKGQEEEIIKNSN